MKTELENLIDNRKFLRRSYDPYWTEKDYSPSGSRDDLGIETLSESILADLLPGINNQTRRARYYSFWAWVLHDFINDNQATHTQSGYYLWLRRREAALILAYLLHNCNEGAAGTTLGKVQWADGNPEIYALDWKSLESVEGGSYELYYRGALLEMNIIQRPIELLHDSLTTGMGLSLAKAYEQAIAPTQYARSYRQATQLRKNDIKELAEYGCLCQVRDHETERRQLIDAFFRFDIPDAVTVKRLASLCFFLDIIAQSNGAPLNQSEFRATLYFWSFGTHHSYQPEGNLLSPAQRWRIFQLRQYFVFAVECFWSLFLYRIEIESLNGPEYLAWLLEKVDLAVLATEFGLHLPSTDARLLRLADLSQAVYDALPVGALESGSIARSTNLNEHYLTNLIRSVGRPLNNVQVFAGNALLQLILINLRCRTWRGKPGWSYVSEPYASQRLPINTYLHHLETAMKEGKTVAEWLGWFHHRYLWLQHRQVTLEKLASRRETAKFELENISPEAAQAQPPRFRGLGLDGPKMNAPRFPSALQIFLDLDLTVLAGEADYQLTEDGQTLLNRFRQYTVPEWIEPQDEEVTDNPESPTGR